MTQYYIRKVVVHEEGRLTVGLLEDTEVKCLIEYKQNTGRLG
ncbi:hypothetical protein [Sporomusa sp. KB1]|nr:hypothetical protein [Sporomusa sp. KB1]